MDMALALHALHRTMVLTMDGDPSVDLPMDTMDLADGPTDGLHLRRRHRGGPYLHVTHPVRLRHATRQWVTGSRP